MFNTEHIVIFLQTCGLRLFVQTLDVLRTNDFRCRAGFSQAAPVKRGANFELYDCWLYTPFRILLGEGGVDNLQGVGCGNSL
jgi:hypothetical protein